MRIGAIYSHLNGREWLLQTRPAMWKQIERYIASIDAEKYRTKKSREASKAKRGRTLLSPIRLNSRLRAQFEKGGWRSQTTTFYVTDDPALLRRIAPLEPRDQKKEIEAAGRIPLQSKNQIDFVKDRVAVEVQLGKYSFIPSDIFVKHVAFYVADRIDLGIEIVPTKRMQLDMSSGPGYFEKALHEIVRQGRGVPAVPLILIGVEPDIPKVTKTALAAAGRAGDDQ